MRYGELKFINNFMNNVPMQVVTYFAGVVAIYGNSIYMKTCIRCIPKQFCNIFCYKTTKILLFLKCIAF